MFTIPKKKVSNFNNLTFKSENRANKIQSKQNKGNYKNYSRKLHLQITKLDSRRNRKSKKTRSNLISDFNSFHKGKPSLSCLT